MRPSRGNDDCAISLSQGQSRIEHVYGRESERAEAFLPEGTKVGTYLRLSVRLYLYVYTPDDRTNNISSRLQTFSTQG